MCFYLCICTVFLSLYIVTCELPNKNDDATQCEKLKIYYLGHKTYITTGFKVAYVNRFLNKLKYLWWIIDSLSFYALGTKISFHYFD